ncbi:MAG TPA: cysteine desulfurase family protein [Gemmatimonadales bacterium]|nr:cysteine desulfurase family protein [Gemmatimonadales bacterium]
MAEREIYLDNAATTRPHPAVVEAITRTLAQEWGNPSSLHNRGLAAERLVGEARAAVARTLDASPEEIVFTSGGTESNNLALQGVAHLARGRHILTTAIEHSSVLTPLRRLSEEGYEVTELPVDGEGRVSPERVAQALRPDTVLVSVMAVNNELGTVQPLEEIGRVIRRHAGGGRPVYFHSDGVQAWGKTPLRLQAWGVDLLSISGHKVHGPKGVGALFIRKGIRLTPLLGGGEQEGAVRPGTENVPGIAGLGAAARLLASDLKDLGPRLSALRDQLRRGLAAIPDARINTPAAGAAPHILNASFPGIRGETLLHRLEMEGIYTSTGSACHAHDPRPSHVLLAIGLAPDLCTSSLRFSLGRFTTTDEIDAAAAAVARAVAELRPLVR